MESLDCRYVVYLGLGCDGARKTEQVDDMEKKKRKEKKKEKKKSGQDEKGAHLKLGIGPARNLNNHVEDGLLLVGVERNVVEGRDGNAILLDVDAVLQGVGSTNLAEGIGRCHGGGL